MDIVVNVGATRPRPAVLTAHDLSTAGWTLDPLRPEATTLVVGGRHISLTPSDGSRFRTLPCGRRRSRGSIRMTADTQRPK
jgi:hypothetical protein